ncbi:MAG: sodium-dependent transporter [Angelakisella sp.]|nr:sodium-dependent transporter [Angelakisella sp.]
MKRENFQSRLGFLLVSAGCAIGIGNVWKFPYITGANGGGVFVLFYLLFLAIMGVPVLTMELAVGRASRKSVVAGYKALEPKGSKWHLHGWVALAGNYLLLMYYTTLSGWMLGYFIKYLTGTFRRIGPEAVDGVFTAMQSSPAQMLALVGLCILGGFAVCSMGLEKGVERITKVMMLALLALIVVLAVHSCTLNGAAEGIRFYLLPDFGRTVEAGLGSVITAAMNQAFFTLSIGMAGMQIFGSYMSRDHGLTGEAVRICLLDTFVAVVSGLIIFPACFSFGVEPAAGPPLVFMTLPKVFMDMAGGQVWGTLFFLFMTFACFSTIIGVVENLLANCIDNFGWSRKKAAVMNFFIVLLGSIPCTLGDSLLKNVTLLGGRNILDAEDFIVSNLLLPGGALVFCLFCATRYGWGFERYLEETNTGSGMRMPRWVRPYFKYILPVLIFIIIVQGLI